MTEDVIWWEIRLPGFISWVTMDIWDYMACRFYYPKLHWHWRVLEALGKVFGNCVLREWCRSGFLVSPGVLEYE